MNDRLDRLEAELADLRPHDASPQPATAHRGSPGSFRVVMAALAVGTCSNGGWAGRRRACGDRFSVEPSKHPAKWSCFTSGLEPTPQVELGVPSPTLMAYQRALARSPEALDARLDKDAALPLGPDPELAQISAFTRSDSALRALLGED